MYKVFGYSLYMSGFGLFIYVFLYLPLAAGAVAVLHRVARRWISSSSVRRAVLGSLVVAVLTFPLWDVVVTSVRANSLCDKEAGVKVYKTVHADGMRFSGLTPEMVAHGFKFTEGDGPGTNKYRRAVRDGQIVEERIDAFTTRYVYGSRPDVRISPQIRRRSKAIVDERSGEVLGEQNYFVINHGRFESVMAFLLGAETSPWICGKPGIYELIFRTITPTSNK